MGEVLDADVDHDTHSTLPVRLANIELSTLVPEKYPFAKMANIIRRELIFQSKILKSDISKNHLITLGVGILAFILGALAGDIFNGGDASIIGLQGIRAIPNAGFFMIASSAILWIYFFSKLIIDFPIMRQQTTLLFVSWISLSYAQVKFHAPNPDFPIGLKFGEMPLGILATTISIFLCYMIWKAIRESRDWHVETYHLSEDVREMEEAMREHSLKSWSFLFMTWLFMCLLNTWSGAHFVGERSAERIDMWLLYLLSGILIPLLIMVLMWFPQKMLGRQGKILSRAASEAEKDLELQDGSGDRNVACQVCGEKAPLKRDQNGDILVPCAAENCNGTGIPSLDCPVCSKTIPTRYTCKNCGTNSPVLDYFPDMEAW